MKKFTTLCVCILLSAVAFGQMNPVQNLNWWHAYDYPNNFYSLSWSAPVASTDTLIGYNVYRNDVLWRFQNQTGLHCIAGSCPDPDFLVGDGCWIKVTAVYNYNHLESVENDSIWDDGIALSVAAGKQIESVLVAPNPLEKGEILHILLNESMRNENCRLILYDNTGENVYERLISGKNLSIEMSTGDLGAGVYYLTLLNGKSGITKKIIIL
jgi:hypothetical protein